MDSIPLTILHWELGPWIIPGHNERTVLNSLTVLIGLRLKNPHITYKLNPGNNSKREVIYLNSDWKVIDDSSLSGENLNTWLAKHLESKSN